MNIFHTNMPAYKVGTVFKAGTHAQPAPCNGLLGLLRSVFGSATPTYKTADGTRAQALGSSSIFGPLLSGAAPSYKTVPAMALRPIDDADLAASDADAGFDEDAFPCALVSDEVVLL